MSNRNTFRILLNILIVILFIPALTSCQSTGQENLIGETPVGRNEVEDSDKDLVEETPVVETQPEPAGAPDVEQELTIGLGRNLYYGPSAWYSVHGSLCVWEPLVILDNELVVQPVLATAWEMSTDGKTWTFKLRQGVNFHDGTPFNADAVLLNVPKLQQEYEKTLPNLESVNKIDDYTVEFVMSEPTPNLPQLIAYFSSAMISPDSIGADGRPESLVGTGPFKFVEYIEGDSIILERNDAYWGEPARLDRVIFKYIPDASTRLAALQAGDIDAIADVGALQPEQAQVIESNPELVLLQQGVATTHYLIFNSGKAPFDDVRLRQAVSMAVDRDLLVEKTLYNYGVPGISVITNRAKSWVRTDIAPRYDMERAAELADEALNGEQIQVRLILNSGLLGRWPYENISQILQQNLAELGIDVEIVTLEGGAWNEALKAGDYQITMSPYTLMTGDPDFFMGIWVHSQGSMNLSRSYGYANQRADELVEAAIVELDPVTRKSQYDELQQIVADEVPFSPLYHEITIYATRKNVHDLYLDVQFKPSLETAFISE